jgi:hypothetical protein
MKTIIVDNFFDNFNLIENEFKKIKLYTREEFNNLHESITGTKETWPGYRSWLLSEVNPFLFNLFLKEFDIKFDNFFNGKLFKAKTHIHLRLKEDEEKDWIHTDDPAHYSFLVYLSKTNLDSGTQLFNEKNELITDIKFVQNRAVLFDSKYNHRSKGNHGTDIHNGRLTFNAFFNII